MGLVAWLDPCCSAHMSVPVDTSTVCVLCEGIDPTVVWGAVRAAEGLRHRGISSPRPAFPGIRFTGWNVDQVWDPAISCRAVDTGRGDWPIFDADERPASERYLYNWIPSASR